MTDLRTAAQQALDALNLVSDEGESKFPATIQGVISDLEAALAQQAEPAQDQRCRAEPRSDGDFVCDCKIGECPRRSAEPAQEPVAWKQGNLVTFNEDPYPALGGLFVQFWDGEEVAARVYANDLETIRQRCAKVNTAPPQQVAQQAEQQPMHPELRKMWEDHFDKCFRAIPVPEQAEPLGWAVQIGTHSAGRRQGKPRYVLFFNKADAEDLADRTRGARPEPFYLEGQPSRTVPVYTAPPQRKPLSEGEIIDAVRDADLDWAKGWTLDEMQGNRFATLVRAVERAHGIGEEK